jgi:hypothetical protein
MSTALHAYIIPAKTGTIRVIHEATLRQTERFGDGTSD